MYAYVRLFSMEKLLTTPAYKVEKLNDETVFIQLTENLTDSVENFAEFQKIRKAVKVIWILMLSIKKKKHINFL